MSFVSGIVFFIVLALGFYGFLSFGAAESLRDTFISTPAPVWTATPPATRSPIPTPIIARTQTPSADVPDARETDEREQQQEPNQPRNRMDCDAIVGTDYQSPEERRWYLGSCTGAPNRADCDAIRGTRYLSPAERNWYLSFCS